MREQLLEPSVVDFTNNPETRRWNSYLKSVELIESSESFRMVKDIYKVRGGTPLDIHDSKTKAHFAVPLPTINDKTYTLFENFSTQDEVVQVTQRTKVDEKDVIITYDFFENKIVERSDGERILTPKEGADLTREIYSAHTLKFAA